MTTLGPAARKSALDAPFALPAAWGRQTGAGQQTGVGLQAGAGLPDTELTVPFADLVAGLSALAATATVTMSTLLLAAHLRVLSSLTAESALYTDVAYSLVENAGDGGQGCEDAANRVTVAFPVAAGAPTWRRLVALVDATERETRTRPDVAGAPVRPVETDPERLMHAMFAADATLGPGSEGYGLRVLAETGQLRLWTAADAVTPTHAERLAVMYRLVLTAMAADPDGDALGALLPAEERRAVLTTWSVGAVIDRGSTTVVDLVRAQALATPQALAVSAAEASLTYRELEERSNQIAHYLKGLGARADTLVGVCMGRSVDLVPTLLGVWKSGAGYLPLDPDLPGDRLRHMMAATRCPWVLSTVEHLSALGTVEHCTLVLLDKEQESVKAQPLTPVGVDIDPAQLAYVIYTSGSTGVPKGVMVAHQGLLNYLLWTVDAYAAHGRGGAPVFSSISFDLGIPSIFTPLLTGQCVHLLPDPFAIADLGEHLVAAGPYSFIKMTPGHLDLLTYQLTADQIHDLAGIVIGAGDSFSAELAARWIELAGPGGTQVATEYGPTEITIGNSGQPIVDTPATELVPLGTPIPNTTMYILDPWLEPVAVGVPGEVYIGGIGVARGYLGRPDLTADRFVPDPYGRAGSRLYRSGDLARWLPDGTMDFLGRIDNQVKIRGYRVELGEIQACLCRFPHVRDAVVIAREVTPGNKQLVAYVVLAFGRSLDAAGLRDHVAAALPEYMIPAAIVAIDRIPLTTNGKVDSRALPALL